MRVGMGGDLQEGVRFVSVKMVILQRKKFFHV
jgi:hypothetical protein